MSARVPFVVGALFHVAMSTWALFAVPDSGVLVHRGVTDTLGTRTNLLAGTLAAWAALIFPLPWLLWWRAERVISAPNVRAVRERFSVAQARSGARRIVLGVFGITNLAVGATMPVTVVHGSGNTVMASWMWAVSAVTVLGVAAVVILRWRRRQ